MLSQLSLILFLPLVSAAVIALFLRTSKWGGAAVSVGSAFAVLIAALWVMLSQTTSFQNSAEIFRLGAFSFNFGYLLDGAGLNMLFVVCFVGFLIHVFSIGYMDDDPCKGRFFAGMSFFMFSMTGIVLSSNLFMMFVFWELVGFSSYALIAHYASTPEATAASKKAFIVNRIGDFGFLLGIIYCQTALGTTDFTELAAIFKSAPDKASTAMGLLLMCGFLGKSAQFPLQVWLGDAMAGPTPISALIHAATMVAAGVFMMVRLSAIGFLTPFVLEFVLVLCALMALCAGFWALGQNDIKKILAYSTLAHLGLMGVGVGLGYELAMFHLTTHAFFKATLFLVAGSVIHACHHEQDIFKMGGLFRRMPLTAIIALAATLSIMAIPFFSGYYSKEGILMAAFARASESSFWLDKTVLVMVVVAAAMTPVYMCRLFANVFFGAPQSEKARNARESSVFMVLPMAVLAVYSVCGAFSYVCDIRWLDGKFDLLVPTSATAFVAEKLSATRAAFEKIPNMETFEWLALALTVAGILVSLAFYGRCKGYDPLERRLPPVYGVLRAHGWFDDIYDWYVAKVQQRFATLLATFADLFIIELVCVRGLGVVCAVMGQGFKKMHDCSSNSQIKWIAAGAVLLFVLIIA